jgi:hypothetical protein
MLTWPKAQPLRGPQDAIFVLGLNQSHDHDRSTWGVYLARFQIYPAWAPSVHDEGLSTGMRF